jgi:hypothetical protein
VTNWDAERVLLKRELAQGSYGTVSNYLSRAALLLPFEVGCVVGTSGRVHFSTVEHRSTMHKLADISAAKLTRLATHHANAMILRFARRSQGPSFNLQLCFRGTVASGSKSQRFPSFCSKLTRSQLAQCVLFVLVSYWLAGFTDDTGGAKFWTFVLALYLFQLVWHWWLTGSCLSTTACLFAACPCLLTHQKCTKPTQGMVGRLRDLN